MGIIDDEQFRFWIKVLAGVRNVGEELFAVGLAATVARSVLGAILSRTLARIPTFGVLFVIFPRTRTSYSSFRPRKKRVGKER